MAVDRAYRGVLTTSARHKRGICNRADCRWCLHDAVQRRSARWVGAAAAGVCELKIELGAVAARRVRTRLEYVDVVTYLTADGASYI
jgi:hypothetical protein